MASLPAKKKAKVTRAEPEEEEIPDHLRCRTEVPRDAEHPYGRCGKRGTILCCQYEESDGDDTRCEAVCDEHANTLAECEAKCGGVFCQYCEEHHHEMEWGWHGGFNEKSDGRCPGAADCTLAQCGKCGATWCQWCLTITDDDGYDPIFCPRPNTHRYPVGSHVSYGGSSGAWLVAEHHTLPNGSRAYTLTDVPDVGTRHGSTHKPKFSTVATEPDVRWYVAPAFKRKSGKYRSGWHRLYKGQRWNQRK